MPTPFGYTIFCDDIRQEIGGKFTLVGVYGPDLIVYGTLPTVLPKLALSVNYMERPGESEDPLELLIYMPGDADDTPTFRSAVAGEALERFRNPIVPSDSGEDMRSAMAFQIQISPIELKQEGVARVRMIRGGDEINLGDLRISARPAAT